MAGVQDVSPWSKGTVGVEKSIDSNRVGEGAWRCSAKDIPNPWTKNTIGLAGSNLWTKNTFSRGHP